MKVAVLKKRNAAEHELSDGECPLPFCLVLVVQVLPLYPALKSIVDHMSPSEGDITECVFWPVLSVARGPYVVLLGSLQHPTGTEDLT